MKNETKKGETATQGITAEVTKTAKTQNSQTDPDLEPLLLLGVLRERLQKMGANVVVRKHINIKGAVQLEANIDGITISIINDMQNGKGAHPFYCNAYTFEMLIFSKDLPEGYLSIDEIVRKIKRELRARKRG